MLSMPRTRSLQIKAIIADMDKEFDVIKTERNAAGGVKKDIYTKLEKANGEMKELEAEHLEAVTAKNNALEALQKIRAGGCRIVVRVGIFLALQSMLCARLPQHDPAVAYRRMP